MVMVGFLVVNRHIIVLFFDGLGERILNDVFIFRVEDEAPPESDEREHKKDEPGEADENRHNGVGDIETPDFEYVAEQSHGSNPTDYRNEAMRFGARKRKSKLTVGEGQSPA